ncbi:MAG: hypothetical protein ACYCY2_01700 [Acidithiobacillus ferriphilus]
MALIYHSIKALTSAAPADSASMVVGIYNNVANAAAAAAGDSVTVALTLAGELPASYGVQVTPSQPCAVSVAKSGNALTITLTPLASTVTLAAGTIDVLVTA